MGAGTARGYHSEGYCMAAVMGATESPKAILKQLEHKKKESELHSWRLQQSLTGSLSVYLLQWECFKWSV